MIHRLDGLRLVTSLLMVLALATRNGERRVVRTLRLALALGPDSAIPLPGLKALRKLGLRRLVTVGAVVGVAEGKYYLDEAALLAFRRRRRLLALVLLGLIGATIGVMWWRGVLR